MAAKVKNPKTKGAGDRGASVTGYGSDDGFAKIRSIAAAINRLQRQNAEALDPVVQHLIRIPSRDVQEIEHTLDQLLDCACVPKGLEVFKCYERQTNSIQSGWLTRIRPCWWRTSPIRA